MLNGFAFDLSGFMTFLLAASGLSFPKIVISVYFVFALDWLIFLAPRFTEILRKGLLQWIEIAAGIEERHIWANTNFLRSWFISISYDAFFHLIGLVN